MPNPQCARDMPYGLWPLVKCLRQVMKRSSNVFSQSTLGRSCGGRWMQTAFPDRNGFRGGVLGTGPQTTDRARGVAVTLGPFCCSPAKRDGHRGPRLEFLHSPRKGKVLRTESFWANRAPPATYWPPFLFRRSGTLRSMRSMVTRSRGTPMPLLGPPAPAPAPVHNVQTARAGEHPTSRWIASGDALWLR